MIYEPRQRCGLESQRKQTTRKPSRPYLQPCIEHAAATIPSLNSSPGMTRKVSSSLRFLCPSCWVIVFPTVNHTHAFALTIHLYLCPLVIHAVVVRPWSLPTYKATSPVKVRDSRNHTHSQCTKLGANRFRQSGDNRRCRKIV